MQGRFEIYDMHEALASIKTTSEPLSISIELSCSVKYQHITVVSLMVAVCHGGAIGEGHSALSSQSIVRHDQPAHGAAYTPLVAHATPLIHAGPIVQHVAPIAHASPILQHLSHAPIAIAREHVEDQAPAHYEFSYSVEDPHTGDHKSQHESREGDVVQGQYSLVQPDGVLKEIKDNNTIQLIYLKFNAVVHNSAPSAQEANLQANVRAAQVAHAGAIVHAGPVVHAGPIVHAVHTAPLNKNWYQTGNGERRVNITIEEFPQELHTINSFMLVKACYVMLCIGTMRKMFEMKQQELDSHIRNTL
ncbi:unnamed protein product [Leptidea sinapis]|uniref:Uncharacterized protein n=1 Tax=Leptidea sinapis TaxID=189913 RepID=A0A5E4Q5F5_9NEOP|nr:unnamed protein product [Leptidea sinapis]